MLKGHTKIELTDVSTGKTEIIEHDNMVTNGMLKVLNKRNITDSPVNIYDCNMHLDRPIYYNWFGGLFIFDAPLSTDPNDFSIPDEVTCVGRGTRDVSQTIDSKLGIYNVTESEVNAKNGTVKWVWDFLTNQANGTISSLSLVSPDVASGGWDTKRDEYIAPPAKSHRGFRVNTSLVSMTQDVDGYLYYDDAYLYGIERGNITVVGPKIRGNHFSSTGKLRIVKNMYPSKKVSIMGFGYTVSIKPLELVAEIQIPNEMMSRISSISDKKDLYFHIEKDQQYIYFFADKQSFAANETFYLLRIDINDFSTSLITMTNTTGRLVEIGIRCGFSYSGIAGFTASSVSGFRIVSGMAVFTSNSLCDIVDINNNTNVKRAKYDNNTSIMDCDVTGFKYKNILFCLKRMVSSDHAFVNCVNVKTGRAFRFYRRVEDSISFCGSFHSESYPRTSIQFLNCFVPHKTDEEMPHFFVDCYEDKIRLQQAFNPLILMTKNNLDTPVVKTSGQTMKITYTLSEDLSGS